MSEAHLALQPLTCVIAFNPHESPRRPHLACHHVPFAEKGSDLSEATYHCKMSVRPGWPRTGLGEASYPSKIITSTSFHSQDDLVRQ